MSSVSQAFGMKPQHHDDTLFAAALLTVGRSGCYTFVKHTEALVISAQCVLACWGHSVVVQRLATRAMGEAVDAALKKAGACPTYVHRVQSRQPFMTPEWRVDPNSNDDLSLAVEALVHRWETKPWRHVRTFVALAERHCINTAKHAQKVMPAFLKEVMQSADEREIQCIVCTQDPVELAELGAMIADKLAPESGAVDRINHAANSP